jgi:hypothetical protein
MSVPEQVQCESGQVVERFDELLRATLGPGDDPVELLVVPRVGREHPAGIPRGGRGALCQGAQPPSCGSVAEAGRRRTSRRRGWRPGTTGPMRLGALVARERVHGWHAAAGQSRSLAPARPPRVRTCGPSRLRALDRSPLGASEQWCRRRRPRGRSAGRGAPQYQSASGDPLRVVGKARPAAIVGQPAGELLEAPDVEFTDVHRAGPRGRRPRRPAAPGRARRSPCRVLDRR